MLRIASLIYTVASATLMGIFIVIALTAGYDTLRYVVIAAAVGAVVAIPVSYYIAQAIKEMG
ncbi:MAG TPA: CTP synthetase [Rhodobacteraceae bacterium]|nr:CTP synthetase [Paracoccaceae bacterium]